MALTTTPPAAPARERPAPSRSRPGSWGTDDPVVTRSRAPRRILPGVVVALSAAAVACYLAVALARIGSPAELEWMEGGVSMHVQRVLDGHSVYGPPSIGFTPYLYTPLFYYVGAAFRAVLGSGLWPLRLVSLVSSIALMTAVARLAWTETRSRWAAVASAGVLAACFSAGGAWLDVARVDTLCLALLFWSLAIARTARRWPVAMAAGALAAAAVMTKQVAALPALAVLPFLWRRDRRLFGAYAGALVGLGVAAAAVLQWTSGGWFLFYAVQVPLHHELVPSEYVGFWTADLWGRLWPAVLAGLGLASWALYGRWQRRRKGAAAIRTAGTVTPVDLWFLVPVTGALVLAAYLSRLHSGGYANVLLPAYGAAALLTAVVLHRLDSRIGSAGPGRRAGRRLRLGAALAAVGTFGVLAYNPASLVPGPGAGAQQQATVAALRTLPGPVYLPGHPMYLAEAGLPTVAQTAAVEDVLRAHIGTTARTLRAQLESLVRGRYFGALVVDSQSDLTVLPPDVCRYYAPAGTLPGWRRLLPVTGTATAPETVWLARPAPLPYDPVGCQSGSTGLRLAAASG